MSEIARSSIENRKIGELNESERGLPPVSGMVWIPAGTFQMGSGHHYPEEAPVHRVTVDGFWMDQYTVTNDAFARFVEATGHVTFAERPPRAEDYPGALPGMLVPGSLVFRKPPQRVDLRTHRQLVGVRAGGGLAASGGADEFAGGAGAVSGGARRLRGRESVRGMGGEGAADRGGMGSCCQGRAGRHRVRWGDEFAPEGKQMANTWQGEFPWENLRTDGYEGTAPVGSFPPNGYGLYDMAGNVWEWTTDWYQPRHPQEAHQGMLRAGQSARRE